MQKIAYWFANLPKSPTTAMAFNPFKNNVVISFAAGLLGAALAPALIPAIKRGSRPVTKGVVKSGMFLYEKGREVAAHTGEMIEDVMAEIHAERAEASESPDQKMDLLPPEEADARPGAAHQGRTGTPADGDKPKE